MKTKVILAAMFMFALTINVNGQWATTCTGNGIQNTNSPDYRVGISACPGIGTYTKYDQLTIGGTSRIRFSATGPSNTWYTQEGGLIGMDADSFMILMGGVKGLYLNGDPNGLDINSIFLAPTGNIGVGTGLLNLTEKLMVDGNVTPYVDNSYSCGTSGKRWSSIWSTNGSIQTSDLRKKTNINSLNYGLVDILKLRPVSYTWKEGDRRVHIGLIAQELKEVMSEVVYESEDENKSLGVAYSDLIPVMIKAIQEQQQLIEKQQQEINELKDQLKSNDATKTTGINQTSGMSGFAMEQNIPNPFSNETVVKYTLPQTISQASMVVYDLTGKQITSFPINKNSSSLTITSEKLSAGIYIYSIVADGQILDSKRMVVAEK